MDDTLLPPASVATPGQQYEDFASESNAGLGGALGAAAGGAEFDLTPPSLGDEAPF